MRGISELDKHLLRKIEAYALCSQSVRDKIFKKIKLTLKPSTVSPDIMAVYFRYGCSQHITVLIHRLITDTDRIYMQILIIFT